MKLKSIVVAISSLSLLAACVQKQYEPVLSEKLTQASYKDLKGHGIVSIKLHRGGFFNTDSSLGYYNSSGVVYTQLVMNNIQQPLGATGIEKLEISVSDRLRVEGVFDKTIPVDKTVNALAGTIHEAIDQIDKELAAVSTWGNKPR